MTQSADDGSAGRQPGTADLPDRMAAAAAFLRGRGVDGADVAVVLGSGLGAFADRLGDADRVPYAEIPHWPPSAVVGHAGVLVSGRLGGRRVIALSGRAHLYEGHAARRCHLRDARDSAPWVCRA